MYYFYIAALNDVRIGEPSKVLQVIFVWRQRPSIYSLLTFFSLNPLAFCGHLHVIHLCLVMHLL